MGERPLDGHDVVDRRAHLGDAVRQAATADSAGPAAGVPDTGSCGKVGPTAGCKECAGRGGSHTHECRTSLAECLTRRGQARARANAEVLEEALLPDSNVLVESAGPRMVRRRRRRKRDKVPQPCQQSSARAVVHKHQWRTAGPTVLVHEGREK